jgi:hypothetical protein
LSPSFSSSLLSCVPPLTLPPIPPLATVWTARFVLRELMKRCKEVLRQFVVDDRQIGNLPLPRYISTILSLPPSPTPIPSFLLTF